MIDSSALRNLLPPHLLPLDAPPSPPLTPLPRAAVLVLVDVTDPGLPLLFTVRSTSLEHHPGEIAFPGGHQDEGDASPADTALREAYEEVHLPKTNVELLGYLPSRQTRGSNVWLTPAVGLLHAPWTIELEPAEVTDVFWTPISTLLDSPHATREFRIEGLERLVHAYTVGEHVIWGVTGNIVADLLDLLGGGRPPDPAAPFPIRL